MIRRLFLLAAWSGLPLLAGPPLTTIQDVLYKADGTRFNGTLTISWKSFLAVDNSDIVTQSTTVKVVDGNLRVQLVPTTTATPAATYRVLYNVDGRLQFEETWAVPSSAQPLHVRDVRTTTPSTVAASDTAPGGSSPIPEASVVGLVADLGARPLKGPSYTAGSVALVDASGMLAAVAGDPSDCVRVDGSSGPCGDASPMFVDASPLTGIVDGANTSFGLSSVPNPVSSLAVYRNGMLQMAGQDYTLSGSTVQFVAAAAPQPGDTLLASFRAPSPGPTNSAVPMTAPQVVCSGAGTSAGAGAAANIGACQIPAGLLQPGDRVEIRFDIAHQGGAGGFSVELDWGATAILHCNGAIGDAMVTGRADAAILTQGAQWSWEEWGTVLPLTASVGSAADRVTEGLTLNFLGSTAEAADRVTLANFTVVRIP